MVSFVAVRIIIPTALFVSSILSFTEVLDFTNLWGHGSKDQPGERPAVVTHT